MSKLPNSTSKLLKKKKLDVKTTENNYYNANETDKNKNAKNNIILGKKWS